MLDQTPERGRRETVGATDAGGSPGSPLTVRQAAAALGVPPRTVKRWCRSGRLRSERRTGPEGEIILVYLSPDDLPSAPPQAIASLESAPRSPAVRRAEAMAEYNQALIAPLLEELSQVRRELVVAAGRAGDLESQLAAANQRIQQLEARRERWRRLSGRDWLELLLTLLTMVVLVALIVGIGVLFIVMLRQVFGY